MGKAPTITPEIKKALTILSLYMSIKLHDEDSVDAALWFLEAINSCRHKNFHKLLYGKEVSCTLCQGYLTCKYLAEINYEGFRQAEID